VSRKKAEAMFFLTHCFFVVFQLLAAGNLAGGAALGGGRRLTI
jgi:hypothetical protein